MSRTKFYLLLIAAFVIPSALIFPASPQDYTISYTFKNPDGSAFRIIKYYMCDGNKFRTDYISTVQYNISTEAESSTNFSDSGNASANSNAQMKAEQLTNAEPHTIEILQKDKKLVWLLDPNYKIFNEVPLKEDSWERAVKGNFLDHSIQLKKTGVITLLNYQCDIYENNQMVKENNWTNIFYVAEGLNVILKTEMLKNGELVQIQEATEFSVEKPASSLFEIPEGYQKI